MSSRSFRSVFMVASCAGAALGCYLVSLRVASERASLEDVETKIVLAQRDMRLLQTEIGTRGRLSQLERWNAGAFALSAPTADQFLKGGFELARLAQPEHKVEFQAPVVHGVRSGADEAAADRRPRNRRFGRAGNGGAECLASSSKLENRDARGPGAVGRRIARDDRQSHGQAGTAAKPAPTKSVAKPGLAAAQITARRAPQKDASAAPKKSVDKAAIARGQAGDKADADCEDRPARAVAGEAFRPFQGLHRRPMNAPSPALVAPRPERLQLVGQRRQLLAVMHQRLMFGMLVYAGVIAIIALRILYLAAFGDHAGRKDGLTALIPERGDIVDRNGDPLARTIDAWTIAVHPTKVIGDKLALAQQLARLMPEQSEEQYFALLRSGKPFFYLRRRASPALVEAVNALGEPGLAIEREPDRLYPQTTLAAHVLGYTDIDGHGVAGMERAFDKYLSDPATRGDPLTLSIDSRVQQALEHELLRRNDQILGDRRRRAW